MKRNYIPVLLLGMIITVSCESPVANNPENIPAAVNVSNEQQKLGNEEFIKKAYSRNGDEIQLAELAKKKSSDNRIKDFADMLIRDHQKANEDLKKIAMNMNVKTSEGLSVEGKIRKEELDMKKADQFNRAYINSIIKEHEKDETLYQQATTELTNASLKEYASGTMKTIKKHLERAREISTSLENSASRNK